MGSERWPRGRRRISGAHVYGPPTWDYLESFGAARCASARRARELRHDGGGRLSPELLAVMGRARFETANGVRRCRRAHAGRRPRPATAGSPTDHGGRGRDHRPAVRPGRLPISTNEMRAAIAPHAARHHRHFLIAQRGFLDYGFIGGAQIDQHGNINTRSSVTLRAAEGAPARYAAAPTTSLAVPRGHHPDRSREASVRRPGRLRHEPGVARRARFAGAGRARVRGRLARRHHPRDLGLRAGKPAHADRGGPRRRDRGRDSGNTGFDLSWLRHHVTEAPSADELALLRALDPERRFLGDHEQDV